MNTISVVKSTGERVPFDISKVMGVCQRIGANKVVCDGIEHEIVAQVRDGMSTADLHKVVIDTVAKHDPVIATRYQLRDALIALGPVGFDFEKYIAELLNAYGYKAELPPMLSGACVDHEVDVLATKDNRTAMIECKLRSLEQGVVTLKDIMATWSRFLDLVDGAALGRCPHVDECWVVTNGRFTHEAVKFGHCKHMVLLSWNHPHERPLPAWIDEKGLYPITILNTISPDAYRALVGEKILLLQQFARMEPEALGSLIGLPAGEAQALITHARMVIDRG